MRNKLIYFVLLSLLLSDLIGSFHQYHSTMLDGDMAGGIVPNQQVKSVLSDPFGFEILRKGEPHANPNRFVPHFLFFQYFRNVPTFLQGFVSPVESIYLASSLVKILVHVLLLYFISALATRSKSILKVNFVLIALLVTTFFQTYGYNNDIGIIDLSITYNFFYAIPALFLLAFLYVLNFYVFQKEKLSISVWVLLLLLGMILPFSGGILPPTVILLSGFFALIYGVKEARNQNKSPWFVLKNSLQKTPKSLVIYGLGFFVLMGYSLWIGTFDNQFDKETIPVSERYELLFKGIQHVFFSKSGFTSLFHLLLVNTVLFIWVLKKVRKSYFLFLLGTFLFSLTYLFLLPLGGYRPYRAEIIRYDSILPITLALFFILAYSSNKVLLYFQKQWIYLTIYVAFLSIIMISFTKKDNEILLKNDCEKSALIAISQSKKRIVPLQQDCYVLSWWEIRNFEDSRENGKLLQILGVTKDAKMYYSAGKNGVE